MLDDGQVFGDEETRYERTAQSTNNTVTNNILTDNVDGIVLEGSSNNSLRYNQIAGLHRYGIRLNGNTDNTLIELNRIQGVERHNIYIYESSDSNQILNNNMIGGRSGLTLDTSNETLFESNLVRDIRGSAIIVQNDVDETVINDNWLHGTGYDVIRLVNNETFDREAILDTNDTRQWKLSPPAILALPTIITWLLIFTIPVFMKMFVSIRHQFGYRYEFKP